MSNALAPPLPVPSTTASSSASDRACAPRVMQALARAFPARPGADVAGVVGAANLLIHSVILPWRQAIARSAQCAANR